MPTDPALLTLFQWLSPAYPISGFAYSHGLESAVSDGRVRDAGTLRDWLADVLTHGSGRSDAVWIRLGAQAPDGAALQALDAEAHAFAPSAERLREALRQGTAFSDTTQAVWGIDLPPVVLPLAVGHAASRKGIAAEQVIPLFAQAFASNMVAAAQRLMALGQTEGQSIIATLTPACQDLVEATEGAGLDDIHSTAFLPDIASMRHETLGVRLFQS